MPHFAKGQFPFSRTKNGFRTFHPHAQGSTLHGVERMPFKCVVNQGSLFLLAQHDVVPKDAQVQQQFHLKVRAIVV